MPLESKPLESDGPVRLTGDLTIERARELQTQLLAAIERNGSLRIEADGVTRIDAAALQVLIAAARAAQGLELIAPSAAWTHALARFGFDATVLLSPRFP